MRSLIIFTSVHVILILCLSVVMTIRVCPRNEEFNNCTQAVCRPLNCSQKGQPIACAAIAEGSCKSGCICKSGYLRSPRGECISQDRCYGNIVCAENELVSTCPGKYANDFCPTSEFCSARSSSSESCAPPRCVCGFNQKRLSICNDTCIPTRSCPPFACSGPNEEFDPCPPYCPTDDCSQATPDGKCPIIGRIGIVLECNPKCRCKKGYWKNNDICVPYAECPQIKGNSTSNCSK